MKSIILAALLVYVSALGSDRCTWGPSHWCHSLDNAKSCGAVQHCTDTVWSHTTNLLDDSTDVCEFCESIIGDVKTFVSSNETEDVVKNYFDAACGIIPIAELAAQCKDTIDTDIDELWDLVRADVDPKMICTLIGLCQGFAKQPVQAPLKTLHHVSLQKDNTRVHVYEVDAPMTTEEPPTTVTTEAPTTTAPPPDLCADCKKLINDMAATITDQTTEDQLEQALKEQVCSQLGPFENMCGTLVDQYTPELLDMLASQMDAGLFCEAIGFCPGGDKMCLIKMRLKKSPLFIAMQQATVDTGDECMFCKIVIEEVQTEIRDPTVQKEVEDFLETNLCSKLGTYKDACSSTVSTYGAMLFQLLASELDPQTVCDNMGLCVAKHAQPSVAATIRAAMPQVRAEQPMVRVTAGKHVEGGSACLICETVMTELKNILDSNKTEEQLTEELEKICTYLPDAIQTPCKDFVSLYGPAVVDLIIQKVDPETICKTIGLCRSAAVAAVSAVKVQGDYCGICETVVTYMDSVITQNATEEEIKAELEKVCGYLPDTIKETCNAFIEENLASLMDLLAKDLSPEEVCTELGLCGSKIPKLKSTSTLAGPLAETANEYCGICETVIQYLDSILVQNASEAQIQAALERVCNFLPDTIKETCDRMVETYLDMIIQLVAKSITPEQVCTELGLCNADQLKIAAVLREMYSPVVEDIPIFKMDDVPIFNNIQTDVKKMEEIVPQKAKMLGVNECTFGPSFWCASEDNAKKCGATSHCQEKVWKN